MGICTMLVVLTSIVWYLKFQKASDEDKDMKPCNAIYYWNCLLYTSPSPRD